MDSVSLFAFENNDGHKGKNLYSLSSKPTNSSFSSESSVLIAW